MSSSYHPKLAVPVVINTRPVERAAPLTHHLQAAGLTVVEIPMLMLQPRPTTAHDMSLMRDWLAGEYNALVVISPTAAGAGLAVWQALARIDAQNSLNQQPEVMCEKAASHLIAVGDATAAVLNDADIAVLSGHMQVRKPKVANNEGMLAMPEIQHLRAGDKVLIWRGRGGRRLLVDALQARGVHIDSIAWYERTMPSDALTHYQRWQQAFFTCHASSDAASPRPPTPIVIVSSGVAFEHWASIVAAGQAHASGQQTDQADRDRAACYLPTLADFCYVVLGERLANRVAGQHLSYCRVADLAPQTILAAIRNHNSNNNNDTFQ